MTRYPLLAVLVASHLCAASASPASPPGRQEPRTAAAGGAASRTTARSQCAVSWCAEGAGLTVRDAGRTTVEFGTKRPACGGR